MKESIRRNSYNIKFGVVYIIYALWMLAEYKFLEFYSDEIYFETESFVWLIFLFPLFLYLLFPVVLKYIGKWKVVKWIDKVIDKWYIIVMERCTGIFVAKAIETRVKEVPATTEVTEVNAVGSEAVETSEKKGRHTSWLGKVLKVIFWIAVVWGILILIYYIPGLSVPAACVAGYLGVRMVKSK